MQLDICCSRAALLLRGPEESVHADLANTPRRSHAGRSHTRRPITHSSALHCTCLELGAGGFSLPSWKLQGSQGAGEDWV